MKKIAAILLALIIAAPAAYAVSPDEAQNAKYQEMKAIKAKQREEREARKAGLANGSIQKKETFWDREAKRSGLSETGNGIGGFVKSLNPVPFFHDQKARYEARKAQGGVK